MGDNWFLRYDRFDPEEERHREALCALGNGYFVTRGAAAESVAGPSHYPGTYVAGVYNRLTTEIAGRPIENEDLVNVPNWLPVRFRWPSANWIDPHGERDNLEVVSFRQSLDLKGAVLHRDVVLRDGDGRETEIVTRRLVHMREAHLAAQEVLLIPLNWSGHIECQSAIDGTVVNAGVARYASLANKHLVPLEAFQDDSEHLCLVVETCQSKVRIAIGSRTQVFCDGRLAETDRTFIERDGFLAHEFGVFAEEGKPLRIEKVVALYTSRDTGISEPSIEAHTAVTRAPSFDELATTQAETWSHLWEQFGIDLADHDTEDYQRLELILRLHIFHLLQTASPNTMDLDVGAPARGLHGESYRGHIFWDELFIFPLLNLRMPEITRSLLKYRYRRLNEARAAAAATGYRGAMYPWQSSSNGREESQKLHLNPESGHWIPDNSSRQRHVNAAIAFNVWQYFEVTGDTEFLSFFGAEMIFEIARFWASLATYNATLDCYEILGVMGPDEYHDAYPDRETPGLDNNAYTNLMAVWVLCRALDLPKHLPSDQRKRLYQKLHLTADEFSLWDEVSRKMRLVFHDGGILSQFEGYDDLKEFDWEGYAKKYGDIQRLDRLLEAEGDSVNCYKASKQADVLMLFYLFSAEELEELVTRLGYEFEPDMIPRTIEYYLSRTSHGSTLSKIVHSWVLARADRAASWGLYREALESDVSDVQGGTTAEGIHLGAMAGTVDLVQRAYTGLEMRGNTLRFNPYLPVEIKHLNMRIRYRGHALAVEIEPDRIRVASTDSGAIPINLDLAGQVYKLAAGASVDVALG